MRTEAAKKLPKSLPRTGSEVPPADLAATVEAYVGWLDHQPLAPSTRRAYRTKVAAFAAWLDSAKPDAGDPLTDPHARDYAVRDFKGDLKEERYSPRSVNLALAALDNFYRFVGLGSPSVRREDLPGEAPRALDLEAQRKLLRAIERRPGARDRAILLLALVGGLRLAELAALDVDDVGVSARKGRVTVRRGKGDAWREVQFCVVGTASRCLSFHSQIGVVSTAVRVSSHNSWPPSPERAEERS